MKRSDLPPGAVPLGRTSRRILATLMTKGPMSIRDLAKECGVTPTPIFDKVKRLKALGLVDAGEPEKGKRNAQGTTHATVIAVRFGGKT